jgi:ABC-type multidrug transport system permease subunit
MWFMFSVRFFFVQIPYLINLELIVPVLNAEVHLSSGLGNIVNPIMSLTSQSVYSIPMLLFIGWRGEPGKRDEPQHSTQGQSTPG